MRKVAVFCIGDDDSDELLESDWLLRTMTPARYRRKMRQRKGV